jgi:hypothetical protein
MDLFAPELSHYWLNPAPHDAGPDVANECTESGSEQEAALHELSERVQAARCVV